MSTVVKSKEEHIRFLIAKYAMRSGEEFKRGLPSIIREAHQSECWREGRKPDGTEFTSLVEWLTTAPPPGCGLGATPDAFTYDEVMQICQTVAPDVAKVMAKERPKGKSGGDRKSAKAKADKEGSSLRRNNGDFSHRQSPSSVAVLTSRLAKEKPKFYQGFLDGKYATITAAAEAAGLVPPGHDPLKRMKQYWKKATKEQRKAFLKWIEEGAA